MSLRHRSRSIWAIAAGVWVLVPLGWQQARAQEVAKPSVTTHEVEGRGDCLMCHGGTMPNVKAVPENHADRPSSACGWCHDKDSEMQRSTPKATTHPVEGRGDCLMCHGGAMPAVKAVPESHAGRENTTCAWCHMPASPA